MSPVLTSPIRDYSQAGEQNAILAAFENRRTRPGRFLDIGAWHPTEISNTRALFELGWSGVMVDVSPGPMRSLLQEYGNDSRISLLQACVTANSRGALAQMQVCDGPYSTNVESYFEIFKGHSDFGRLFVPTVTLLQILQCEDFGPFDFINLDTEGTSSDLFLSLVGLHMWRVRCICVEHDGRVEELKAAATKVGYECSFENGVNLVFTHSAPMAKGVAL